MTGHPEIWNALAAEFPPGLVRERPAGGGRMVRYITARSTMNRLDHVLGFENWWDTYERDPGGSDNILCRLSVRLPDGQIVTKCDVGAPGNTGDEGEDDKGAVSDAFKRAAVKFGVGRYLYGEGVYLCPTPEPAPGAGRDRPPALPERNGASIESHTPAPPPAPAAAPVGNGSSSGIARDPRSPASPRKERGKWGHPGPQGPPPRSVGVPRTGKSLYGWLKDQEAGGAAGLLKYIDRFGALNEMPKRMVDWSEDEVKLAHEEAVRKLESIPVGSEG